MTDKERKRIANRKYYEKNKDRLAEKWKNDDKRKEYLKEYYKDEPLFNNSKVVVSVYGNEISGNLDSKMVKKIQYDEIESETLQVLEKPTYLDLYKNAILNSDGVVIAVSYTHLTLPTICSV